jgi:hypothetical protein
MDALRCDKNIWKIRNDMEKKLLEHFKIQLKLLNNHNYIINKIDEEQIFKIQSNIHKRYLLNNIKNINYNPEKNNYNDKHIDFKYINKNIIMITITFFNKKNINNCIKFSIDNDEFNFKLRLNNFSSRQTFFIKINTKTIEEARIY